DAASAIEENDEGAVAARRARELYRLAGRPIEAAGMLLSMSTFPFRSGAAHAEIGVFGHQALDEIADLSVTPERERLRAALLSDLANDLFLSSDLEAARIQAVASRDLAESVGDHETVLEGDLMLARIQIGAGRTDAGIRDGMRAAREARDRGFESVGVTGYRNVAIMAARVMDYGAAQAAIGEGLQYADAIEQSHCRQMMATTLALIDWASGSWDAADSRARQELVDRGCRRGVIGALDIIGLVALGRGRPDEARRWLDESLATGRTIGEGQLVLTPLWGLAETDLLAGDADGAIARCREGLSIALASEERALLIPFVVTGVRSFLAARRPDDAERWVTELRGLLATWQSTAGPALAHAEGLVRLAAGVTVAARSALESAVNGWDARDRVWDATWARLDLAAALLRSSRFAEASRWLSEASDTAHALASGPLLARVAELERQVRGRGADPELWFPLTIREFEVARLVAAGRTNAQIAEELFVAPKTVSAHVEHILAKLNVSRRSEIAAWAATIARPDGRERGIGGSTTRAEAIAR
ncbi:MAG: LuxR C-terminal-related transcriptional regulator, partial [Candidatus Limnocylindrales bacterium]